MRGLVEFLQKWSPHIWMFGSVFGCILSGILLKQAYTQRLLLRNTDRADTSAFWFRHGMWFFLMHLGYVVVGAISLARLESDWASLVVMVTLVATPLILVYRSYDSLRQNSSQVHE